MQIRCNNILLKCILVRKFALKKKNIYIKNKNGRKERVLVKYKHNKIVDRFIYLTEGKIKVLNANFNLQNKSNIFYL